MKVDLINTYPTGGGAANACVRLFQSLNRQREISAYLVSDGLIQNDPHDVQSLRKKAKYLNLLRYFIERYLVKSVLRKNKLGSLFSPAIVSNPYCFNLLNNNRSDILHLHWINHGFIGLNSLLKLKSINRPIVWTLHDMWPFTGGCHYSTDCNNFQNECGSCFYLKESAPLDLSHEIWKKKNKAFKDLDITVVSPSNWLANKAKASSLFQERRIEVIPNPIDCCIFKPKDRYLAKTELKLPLGKKHICFVAANITNPFKGIIELIEALKTLETLFVDTSEIEILVLGKIESEDLFSDLKFKAHFGGFITSEADMVSYYNAADVFVLPSLQDNLPNTVMEALACGTPVAAFDTGGVSDMVDENVGYLAKYNDSEDLAQGLFELLSNDHDRLRKGENAVEKVRANFSYPIVAKKYSELYHQVVKQYQSA